MNPVTKLTIAAQSDYEFDDVLARTNDLCGLAIDLKTGNSFYKTLVVREVRADPKEKVISIDFDTNALKIFGAQLDGLEALAAAENASRH